MSSYNPPSESITQFNTSLFNQPIVSLSQADADLLYLSKSKNDISTASLTQFNGAVTINGNSSVGTNAGSNNLSVKGEQRFYDTASPYTSYAKISTNGLITNYESPNVGSSSHIFKSYLSGVLTGSLFEVTSSYNISRQIHYFTNRINLTASSYSFPFSQSSYQGYYLTNTSSTFTTLTTATPKTILTSSIQIPSGVWRVDFSVQNLVTTAGTISSAQSFVSTSLDGNVGTAVAFTGSVLRSHVSEVYAIGDVQVITSSFTLNQSTAGFLYLNIVRSFATGAYTFTGEMSYTRIA